MFRYRLKNLGRICVHEYVYMTSCYTGSSGRSKFYPPLQFQQNSFPEVPLNTRQKWGEMQRAKKKGLREILITP